ncbi:MAG: SAM-dependent methyltransferase [Pedobacter sp.]|nr:MAG: SAM-dependent methyltransferase [Pedobacter sp.]
MATSSSHFEIFRSTFAESLEQNTFAKLSLGNYHGAEADLKNIYVKPVVIKRTPQLSFTYRFRTKDIVKNHPFKEGILAVEEFLRNDFRVATLFTNSAEIQFEVLPSGKHALRNKGLATKLAVALNHDKDKKRLVKAEGQSYLQALQITDAAGAVFHNAQDKFKQINRFVEVLSPMLKDLPKGRIKRVADMGSGKGYLTFGLHDYLHSTLGWETEVTGVEYRDDLVSLCNKIAHDSGHKTLNFLEGSIEKFDASGVDMLIALHACDTATDDAIFKGITANSALIVVAPCCHKQIRKEMERNKVEHDLTFLTRHGVFLERQAEMVTDSIRALILEYSGYKVKVFEFISDAHTPKNVLIVGVKAEGMKAEDVTERKKEVIVDKIQEARTFFGIGYHHLQRLMGI